MESPLGPTIANVLSFFKVEWLQKCPREFKPVFYKDILMTFNTCRPNMSSFLNKKKNGQL